MGYSTKEHKKRKRELSEQGVSPEWTPESRKPGKVEPRTCHFCGKKVPDTFKALIWVERHGYQDSKPVRSIRYYHACPRCARRMEDGDVGE